MRFSKLTEVHTPDRGTSQSAGIDFYLPENFNRCRQTLIQPGESLFAPLGLKVEIPMGFALVFFNKSKIATVNNLTVGACIIDADYEGEIHVHLINVGNVPVIVKPGQKIVQGVLMPVYLGHVQEVPESDLYPERRYRGEGGFGSTGDGLIVDNIKCPICSRVFSEGDERFPTAKGDICRTCCKSEFPELLHANDAVHTATVYFDDVCSDCGKAIESGEKFYRTYAGIKCTKCKKK